MLLKELGKPTTSASSVLCVFNKNKAPGDPSFSKSLGPPNTPPTETRKKGEKKALNPGAYNVRPIAQTREELGSLAKCNRNSNDTEIPNAETCLSRIKTSPVVEDKARNSKAGNSKNLQASMWTGPSWRSIVAQQRGSSADKWWVRCDTGLRSDNASSPNVEAAAAATAII